MARFTNDRDLGPVLDAFKQWIDSCLVKDGSVFSDSALWSPEIISQVHKAFIDHPDLGEDDFMTKLKGQLKDAPPSTQRLMSEMLWVLLLFPVNIRVETKRQQIGEIWALSGEKLSESLPMLSEVVLEGIGSAGQGYNNHRWRELAYLIQIAGHIKQKSAAERKRIISDYDVFIEWISSVPEEGKRQFKQMLRFFAFPDRVERMSSASERRAVLEGLDIAPEKETKKWNDRQLDDALLALRNKLQSENPTAKFDFYASPFREMWDFEEGENEARFFFTAEECEVFGRYPNSVGWREVSQSDQELFKGVRLKLKEISQALVGNAKKLLPMKAETSHPTPNGRSPREIWCCVFPESVPNKSYGLQVALIISARGAEICFCLGSGTSQVGDTGKRRELEVALNAARSAIRRLPESLVKEVERSQKRKWFYRKSWLANPNEADFASLADWINFVGKPEGAGASVSVYFSPVELSQLGTNIYKVFDEALETFGPILAKVYLTSNARKAASSPVRIFDAKALTSALEAIAATHARVDYSFLSRLVTSLAAKPFVILTGNSGTGKTKLAQLFASWLTGNADEAESGYTVVPVGADWTDSRHVVGFINHLRKDTDSNPIYQSTAILDLLLRATSQADRPFFLILDEMNLSHVERYFADFLSAMESNRPVPLHAEPGALKTSQGTVVENAVFIPDNLFVIGTVNVDETTYMFSSKVLDRANVLEFRITEDDARAFLEDGSTGLKSIDAAAPGHAEAFMQLCRNARATPHPDLTLGKESENPSSRAMEGLNECKRVLKQLMGVLRTARAEFAYRTMAEILRYVYLDYELAQDRGSWEWAKCMDAQILQKILPKLHGSKKRVGPLLVSLAKYCEDGDVDEALRYSREERNPDAFKAADIDRSKSPKFRLSYEKLCDMVMAVRRDQFVSFIQ